MLIRCVWHAFIGMFSTEPRLDRSFEQHRALARRDIDKSAAWATRASIDIKHLGSYHCLTTAAVSYYYSDIILTILLNLGTCGRAFGTGAHECLSCQDFPLTKKAVVKRMSVYEPCNQLWKSREQQTSSAASPPHIKLLAHTGSMLTTFRHPS